jgi:hypothetical protein
MFVCYRNSWPLARRKFATSSTNAARNTEWITAPIKAAQSLAGVSLCTGGVVTADTVVTGVVTGVAFPRCLTWSRG